MFGRQAVVLTGPVVIDDRSRDQRTEPLADVAFVAARGPGDLRAGRWRQTGHGVEQTGAMPDRDHQAQGGVIEHADEAIGEGFLARLVERRGGEIGGHGGTPEAERG